MGALPTFPPTIFGRVFGICDLAARLPGGREVVNKGKSGCNLIECSCNQGKSALERAFAVEPNMNRRSEVESGADEQQRGEIREYNRPASRELTVQIGGFGGSGTLHRLVAHATGRAGRNDKYLIRHHFAFRSRACYRRSLGLVNI